MGSGIRSEEGKGNKALENGSRRATKFNIFHLFCVDICVFYGHLYFARLANLIYWLM